MHKLTGEHLQLINEISATIQFCCTLEDDKVLEELKGDLKDALSSFGFTQETGIIKSLNSFGQEKETQTEFLTFFDRFYASALIMISNSFKTSPDYRVGQYKCDKDFAAFVKIIKSKSINRLCEIVMHNFEELQKNNPENYDFITAQSINWYFQGDRLDGIGGKSNSLITSRMTTLKENIEKIEELYDVLQDNQSKDTLNGIIKSWLTFDLSLVYAAGENVVRVFNTNVFVPYENEVMVDCGSYIGDTVEEYVQQFGDGYKRIYTYDISAPTVEILRTNLSDYKNIVSYVKGVGEKADILYLNGVERPFEGNKLTNEMAITNIAVPVVTLDEDIKEEITFLKIDVEGLDKEAIRGAKGHIINERPKIHIDCYHRLEDFFEVPFLLESINPTYGFYLRAQGNLSGELRCVYPTILVV